MTYGCGSETRAAVIIADTLGETTAEGKMLPTIFDPGLLIIIKTGNTRIKRRHNGKPRADAKDYNGRVVMSIERVK